MQKIALKKFVLVCDTHRFVFCFFSFSLWDWEGKSHSKRQKRLWHSFIYCVAFVGSVYQIDLYPPRRLMSQHKNHSVAEESLNLLCEILKSVGVKGKKCKKPTWLDSAAGSKLVTKKYGRLVYVCFIEHLFLVLFLAALAAGCQQGSWFWSSVQI